MRRIIAIGVTAAALAATCGTAAAATFYVDDSGPPPVGSCTTPANSCQTITAAVTQARVITGPDTIQVAAGTYTGETGGVKLNDAADAGDTIDGAGSGTGAGSTVIRLPTDQDLEVHESNVTLRGVTIEPTNFQPVYIGDFGFSVPSGVTFDDVQVQLDNTISAQAVQVDRSTNTTLNHLTVDGGPDWGGTTAYALNTSQSTNTVVNDSSLHSANGPVILNRISTLTLNRTLVLGTPDLDQPVVSSLAENIAGPSSLLLDSSLIALGSVGIKVDATGSGTSATATIRNSTIDPGVPKDTTAAAVATTQLNNPSSTTVGIDSSIIVGGVTSVGVMTGATGATTCTNTDVPDTVQA